MFFIQCATIFAFVCLVSADTADTAETPMFPVEPLIFPDPNQKSFEFHLYIANRYTMVMYSEKWPHQGPKNGIPKILDYDLQNESFIHRDNLNLYAPCAQTASITNQNVSEAYKSDRFIFGAGTHRRVITVNGRMPGPTLVVNQNSNLTVYVHNELFAEACTVHFHGFRQKNTWWMDGVAGLQQCPISPGSTFVYQIYADQPGTFWYHGHLGTESNQGLMGAVVVIPESETIESPKQNEHILLSNGTVITPTRQFILSFHEQLTNSVTDAYFTTTHYAFKQFDNMNDPSKPCFFPSRTPDRSGGSPITISDILINGQGWHNKTDLIFQPWKIPMQTYTVKRGHAYLFRMIDVGVQVVMKLGIENHKLHVVATDSYAIKAKVVDSIAASPGERFDFLLIADQEPGTYYIVIETIETINWFTNETTNQKVFGAARIQYEGVPIKTRPLSDLSKQCTSANPCKMLNCPWERFAPSFHTNCVHLSELENYDSSVNADLLLAGYDSSFEEHFLRITSFDAFNGWRFMHPTAPPYFYTKNVSQVMMPCDKQRCLSDDECTCTSVLRVTSGNVVQLVIHQTHNLDRMSHPFHIHGHHFIVVKQGYGTYNETSGYMILQNQDVECFGDNETCFESSWKNETWLNGRLPELKLYRPILKDTIMVPAGGFVVIRYKADNPGWWFMHCHAILHHSVGMAMAVQEGDNSEMSAPPSGRPQCGYIDITLNAASNYSAFYLLTCIFFFGVMHRQFCF